MKACRWILLGVYLALSSCLMKHALAGQETPPADLEKAVGRVRRDLANQTEEYDRVLRSLQKINRRMKRHVEERSKLEQERILTEAQMKGVVEKMKQLEGKIPLQRAKLLTKLRSMNQFNQESWLRFLFEARNSAQLERNMKVLGLIGRRDVDFMKDFSRLIRDYERRKNEFVNHIADLKKLQTKIQDTENNLREQTESRGRILGQMKAKQIRTLARLRKLQESGGEIGGRLAETGLLDALWKSSFAERKGQLAHPVDGPVTQNYGVIRDLEYHLILSHRGWMYEAPEKASVRSVFEGQVVHQGFLPEYGRFLIVDHADHFYSVYGMLDTPSVKVGDLVKEGQSLGLVGTNPFDGRSGLYFEIRHFAETVDPKVWMKGKVYEISTL